MKRSNGTSIHDGEKLCKFILKSIQNCRSYSLVKKFDLQANVTLTLGLPEQIFKWKSTYDGEQLCQIILKSIHNCRSYDPDKFGRMHIHIRELKPPLYITCQKHRHSSTRLHAKCSSPINSLPNDKILDWYKLKEFADDILKVAQITKFVPKSLENIEGKGENAGYQHFLLFPQCFQKLFDLQVLNVGIVW